MTQLDQFTIFANYRGTDRPYKAPRRKAALRDGAVRLFLCLSVCLSFGLPVIIISRKIHRAYTSRVFHPAVFTKRRYTRNNRG